MVSREHCSCAYLISGLCSAALSLAFVAPATAAGVSGTAAAALVRSLIPSFALVSALLCIAASWQDLQLSGGRTVIRKQLFSAQLASTGATILLIVVELIIFSASGTVLDCYSNKKSFASVLFDEVLLAAIMTSALAASAVLGLLEGRRLARASAAADSAASSGPALMPESQRHIISAANRKRRPPTPAAAAGAAATAATADIAESQPVAAAAAAAAASSPFKV